MSEVNEHERVFHGAARGRGRVGTWRIDDGLEHTLRKYADLGRFCSFTKQQTLYEQGDLSRRFYLLLNGLVQESITRKDGSEVILEFMGSGTLCGEAAALDGLPRFSRAVATESTDAVEFDMAKMTGIFAQYPELGGTLLRVTSLKQRALAVRLEQLSTREPEDRIVSLLSCLQATASVGRMNGRLLETHLTHKQIAAMTGTSRVTVTRTLCRLRRRGVIDLLNRRILIKAAVL